MNIAKQTKTKEKMNKKKKQIEKQNTAVNIRMNTYRKSQTFFNGTLLYI